MTKRRAESYIGGHTVITMSPQAYDSALETQATIERRRHFDAQAEFDKAREVIRRLIGRSLLATETETIEKQAFGRLRDYCSALRRECAMWRVRAQKAERELNQLKKLTRPQDLG